MNAKTKQVQAALIVLLQNCNNEQAFDEAVDNIFEAAEESPVNDPRVTLLLFEKVMQEIRVAADPETYLPDHPTDDPIEQAYEKSESAGRLPLPA